MGANRTEFCCGVVWLVVVCSLVHACAGDVIPIDGYSLYPGFGFYKYYKTIKTWADAWKQCDSDGSHLAIINSEAEAQIMKQLLTGVNPQHYTYIGYHKHYTPDIYLTIHGKRLDKSGYYKWAPGKPSSDANHKCGAVLPSGLLVNKDCTGQWGFIFLCQQRKSREGEETMSQAFTQSLEEAARGRIMGFLENLQMNVEKLRNLALKLQEDREMFLSTLDVLRDSESMTELNDCDRDEAINYVDQVVNRCLTVDIEVRTNRDKSQEDALHQVNSLIDILVVNLHEDPSGTRTRCLAYMNACSSQLQGITDKKFENAILDCALDDQKRVKKRLQGLLSYIDQALERRTEN